MAQQGSAGHGKVRFGRQGLAGRGEVRQDMVWQARQRTVWLGMAR